MKRKTVILSRLQAKWRWRKADKADTKKRRWPSRQKPVGAYDSGDEDRRHIVLLRIKVGSSDFESTLRTSAIDARTTRHAGYDVSQKRRKRIEECLSLRHVFEQEYRALFHNRIE
jgi:hypothetical protein